MSENKLAQNLKTLMQIDSISPTQLARKTGVGQPVIFRIAAGETDNPKLATIRPIANYFRKSISQLVGDEPLLSEQAFKNVSRVPLIKMTETLGWAQNANDEHTTEFVIYDHQISDTAFAVQVEDMTMAPQFQPGSILVVDPHKTPKDRDYVIAHQKDHKSPTFKQLLIDGDEKYLKPMNPDFKTAPITEDHVILGTVVRVRQDFETATA